MVNVPAGIPVIGFAVFVIVTGDTCELIQVVPPLIE